LNITLPLCNKLFKSLQTNDTDTFSVQIIPSQVLALVFVFFCFLVAWLAIRTH